ncbi:MAG: LVIVD repeat-containing protein [Halolamina sp.]
MDRRQFLRRLGVAASAVGSGGAAGVVDAAAHPGHIAPSGRLELRGTKEAVVADGIAYVAVSDGYATVDLGDPAEPTVLAERRDLLADRDPGPLRGVFDVAVDGDRLLVVGPANPGVNGSVGVVVVDVADPSDPQRLGFYPTGFPIHNATLDDDLAYLTGNERGLSELVILDVTDGSELGRWNLADADERWAEGPTPAYPLHDVTVRGDVAVLAHWEAGTQLLDVSNPADPTHLSRTGDYTPAELADYPRERLGVEYTSVPGNSHYAALNDAGDLLAVGHEGWAVETDDGGLVGGPGGVDLYDVTDRTAPAHLSRIDPPVAADPTRAGVWTTAHNFAFDGDTLYTTWYHGGVKRHDVSDPTDPTERTWWRDHERARFWAVAVVNDDAFLASSMGVQGTGDGAAGLWTFPDEDGTGGQPLPERSREPSDRLVPGETPAATNGTAASPTRTATATQSPTETATTSPAEEAETTDESGVSGPGFGLAAGALGVGLGALAVRRRDSHDES